MNGLARRGDVPLALLQAARPRSLLRAALLEWFWIGGCWLAMAHGPALLLPLWTLAVAGRLHALGVVLHDACHLRRRHATPAVRLVELLAGFPVMSTLAAMRYHHLRHHHHSGTSLDPYFKPGASDRIGPALLGRLRGLVLPLAWYLRAYLGCLALPVPGLRNIYAHVFLGDRATGDLAQHAQVRRCLRAEPAQALFFLALLPLAVARPGAVCIAYVVPLCVAGLLNANRVIAEHLHVPCAGRDMQSTLATTRTHAGGLLERAFLYPRHIGLHAVHHLHPGAAMQALPALHAWYLANEPAYRGQGPTRAPRRPA
jgi:fatty acid desaturase